MRIAGLTLALGLLAATAVAELSVSDQIKVLEIKQRATEVQAQALQIYGHPQATQQIKGFAQTIAHRSENIYNRCEKLLD